MTESPAESSIAARGAAALAVAGWRRIAGSWRNDAAIGLGVLLLVTLVVVELGVGAVSIAPQQVISILLATVGVDLGWRHETVQESVLLAIRLPRVLLAGLVGAALAAAGAAIQGMFRNPLADPALIGVSSGAAMATALAIVAGPLAVPQLAAAQSWFLPAAGFAGGTVTTLLIVRIARRGDGTEVATMLLAGIAINALSGAVTGLLVFLADDVQLRDITFWSLGSLAGATWAKLAAAAPLIAPCLVLLPAHAAALNAFLLGEDEALLLGVDVERLKRRIVLLSAMGVGAAVSVSGVIGFVGLVVPHVVRLAVGADHHRLLPNAAIYGAAALLAADLLSRTLVPPAELPIGTVTAAAGAPVFLWMLVRRGGGWL